MRKKGLEPNWMTSYRKHLQHKGAPKVSWMHTMSCMRLFGRFLEENDLTVVQVKRSDISQFKQWLADGTRSQGTIYDYIGEVKRLYAYLVSTGQAGRNPVVDITDVVPVYRLPKHVAKEDEIQSLLNSLKTFLVDGEDLVEATRRYTVHVLAEFLYSTGVRISEAAKVTIDDIDLEKGQVWVRSAKGGRSRVCFLNSYTKEILTLYVRRVRKLLQNKKRTSSSLLFQLSAGVLQSHVANVVSGLEEEVSLRCHDFRHAFASHMLRHGCDIRYIAHFLGHKRLQSTQIYTKLEKEDMKQMLASFHPRKLHPAG